MTGAVRVVNGPTGLGPNPAQTRNYKPEPGSNPKTNLKPKPCLKNTKAKLGLKNLAMLPSHFYFSHLRPGASLRPDQSPKFLSILGPNPVRIRSRLKKPGLTYNSGGSSVAKGGGGGGRLQSPSHWPVSQSAEEKYHIF